MREVNNANTTKTTLEAKHFRTLIAKTRTKNVFGFSNLLQTQLSKPLDILAVFFLKNRSQLQMELCYKKLLRNLVLHESKQQSTGNCSHLQKKIKILIMHSRSVQEGVITLTHPSSLGLVISPRHCTGRRKPEEILGCVVGQHQAAHKQHFAVHVRNNIRFPWR